MRGVHPVTDRGDAALALDRTLGRIRRVWQREPVPRAEIRLLDPWPGGPYRKLRTATITRRAYDLLERELPGPPSGVRLLVRDVRGHELVVARRWDRLAGTLTASGGGPAVPLDLPLLSLRAALGPLFLGEGTPVTTLAGEPAADVLEMTYRTRDRGHADLPGLRPLAECVARLSSQLPRHAGNQAVFTGRSGAVAGAPRRRRAVAVAGDAGRRGRHRAGPAGERGGGRARAGDPGP